MHLPADTTPGPGTALRPEQQNPWPTYIILLISSFITFEAAAFQTPAIPTIARYFGVSAGVAALVSMIYYLALIVCSPIFGRVADIFGRKRVLVSGMIVFAVSEFMAALSPSFELLLVARFFQGLAVACVLPVVLSYVGYLFAPEKRGMPLGVMVFSASLGATSGAVIGGVLIDTLGWRSIYTISGVLAIGGLLLVLWKIPETARSDKPYRFDIPGAALLLVSIAALLATPTFISRFGFASTEAWGCFLLGVISMAVLWQLQKRSAAPVLDTTILGKPAFFLPGSIYLLFLICYGGTIYSLAFFVNDRPGGSASQVGLINTFAFGASMLAGLISGKLVDKFSEKSVIIAIVLLMGAGLLLFTRIELDTSLWVLALTVSILGLAQGMKGPAIMKITLRQVPAEKMSAGSGLFSMMRDFGTPAGVAIGLALYSSSLARNTQEQILTQAQALGLDPALLPALADAFVSKGATMPAELQQGLAAINADYAALAETAGYNGIAIAIPEVGMILFPVLGLTLLLTLLLPRTGGASPAGQPPAGH